MTRLALAALAALISTAAACDGYAELPLALREAGPLRVIAVHRFTEGPGRVELALDPPSDALGPFAIVGHPAALSPGAEVLSWALGPCDPDATPPDPALRLCLAVAWGAASAGEPLAVAVVLESRADARRFTLFGAEATP